jgi:hypothetical protein
MSSKYEEAIAAASKTIAEAILGQEANLVEKARDVDSIVLGIVREVGRNATEHVVNVTAVEETERVSSSEGLTPQHRKRTPFLPSSGKSSSNRRTSETRKRS